MASHKTSSKEKKSFVPRRAHCICPICGKEISLNTADYRKYQKAGTAPCCSRICAGKRRTMQFNLQKAPDESRDSAYG